jgi:hypothetical protein
MPRKRAQDSLKAFVAPPAVKVRPPVIDVYGDVFRAAAESPEPTTEPDDDGPEPWQSESLAVLGTHYETSLGALHEMDRKLVELGWPPISDLWWQWIHDVYDSGANVAVIQGGRRGGKSTTGCRLLVAEGLFGQHEIPPGDTGVCAIVSVSKPEAKERLATIEALLKALGYKETRDAKEPGFFSSSAERVRVLIRSRGRVVPIEFRVYAATIKGVVGFTAVAIWLDEMARWSDPDSGANPAREVWQSIKPTMSSAGVRKWAKAWLVSSPMSTLDLHYEMHAAGNTGKQRAFRGATWELNPTITEADTREDQPDEFYWTREFAAVPTASFVAQYFPAELLDIACAREVEACDTFHAGADFGFTRNASALAIVGIDSEQAVIALRAIEARRPSPGAPLRPTQVVREFARIALEWECADIACDTHYQETVNEQLDGLGIGRIPLPNSTVVQGVILRRLLSSESIALKGLPAQVYRQLCGVSMRVTDSGNEVLILPKNGDQHSDETAALLAAIWRASEQVGVASMGSGWTSNRRRLAPGRDAEHDPDDDQEDDLGLAGAGRSERDWM